ncbi:MAG TPA: hypothetical protein DCZ76_04150 [Treponema sp.]|nr:hypothetical protein [Treponema sp.]
MFTFEFPHEANRIAKTIIKEIAANNFFTINSSHRHAKKAQCTFIKFQKLTIKAKKNPVGA